jgi:hypothetical protein
MLPAGVVSGYRSVIENVISGLTVSRYKTINRFEQTSEVCLLFKAE